MMAPFRDRTEAGRLLATRLQKYAQRSDVLVLALPRGGVPVGFQVAQALNARFDVFLVRKLGVPGEEELAMGAIASSAGIRVLNDAVVRAQQISPELIEQVAAREQRELDRRERAYRGDRPPPDLHNRTIILVDDGLATGATMRAAVTALRRQNPAHIVVAVPTAAPETCEEFRELVDDIVCAFTPEPFRAVGQWYEDFSDPSDAQIRELLEQSAHAQFAGARRT